MDKFILQLGIMSMQACIIIGVVLLVREIFSRAGIAKKYINILWMLPYVCMICPWKFEGAFGFWRQPQSDSSKFATLELVQTLRTLKDGASNSLTEQALASTEAVTGAEVSVSLVEGQVTDLLSTPLSSTLNTDVLQVLLAMSGVIWLVGVIGLLLYSADVHLKLHRKLICCMHVKDNIYLADDIKVPFVLGIFKPRIYLPGGMSELDKQYVVAHEKTHIRHLDPLKKAVAFGITCLHWFNPLAWVAFHFYSKDMEMACDEETVQQLGMEHRQSYAATLLSLAIGKKLFLGVPLAFDEGDVRSRVKNIVKYKKTWNVLSVVAVAVIGTLTIGFMTEQKEYVPLAKVQDMNHPPKEMTSNAFIITLNGETRYFSGEGYFNKISKFLNGLEIRKIPKDQSRDENREKDVIIEYGALRFCFYADYAALWSDNDVKASFTYQVKNPEEVKAYLEGLFNGDPVVDENFFTEIFIGEEIAKTEKEETALGLSEMEEVARNSEIREFTMEELLELCEVRPEVFVQTVEAIPWGEEGPLIPALYNNLELGYDHKGEWTGSYFAYLTFEGKEYRVQFGFNVDTLALWGVYLYYPAADDMILLYTNEPERYTVNNDIGEFLNREYNMDDYFTCTLPEGTYLGDYKIYYNDVFHGCPILGNYEPPAYGDGTGEAWYAPGCILIGNNDENNNRMQFENGKAVSARWIGNHRWMEKEFEYIEGCEMQALLYEVHFDLFTAASAYDYMQKHNLSEEELQTVSDYWYVFMGEEDSEYIYIVALNQEYFTKEDVKELARSVHITYE